MRVGLEERGEWGEGEYGCPADGEAKEHHRQHAELVTQEMPLWALKSALHVCECSHEQEEVVSIA